LRIGEGLLALESPEKVELQSVGNLVKEAVKLLRGNISHD
jgi:hypothetical protein